MAMNAPRGATGRLGDMSTTALTRTRFPSAVLVAVGLAVGFGVAQGTGVRALGGAVFAAGGLAAAWLWVQRRGPVGHATTIDSPSRPRRPIPKPQDLTVSVPASRSVSDSRKAPAA